MMATAWEIPFLKHEDKNHFIYPSLCYSEIVCVSFTVLIE